MGDRNLLQIELTCDQAAFVIEALVQKYDELYDKLRSAKWELDAAKRKLEAKEITLVTAKGNPRNGRTLKKTAKEAR